LPLDFAPLTSWRACSTQHTQSSTLLQGIYMHNCGVKQIQKTLCPIC
jgi:hypothetical protein